ncbi:hypothetical protein CTRI78_v011536 [Colletotrichum trifolii]|uniref:Uncharacterized protein n=2 Tax=Colletotrichum orbiculare species complex TaxID=2707354 RepID=A0A4R8QGK0_COLTR|nr:hypothetical protein CTRI78_v011536 [Colletotrichum trifolii]
MDDVVLENMRRHIVKAFLYYIKLNEKDSRDYLRPCPSWDGVRKMKHRGCLLWLPQPEGESLEHRTGLSALEQFATFDVPYAKWQKSLPIYDLERLLGPDHLATLRELPLFRENSLLMLGKRRSIPTQLYLWKIQGYLATFPELDEFDAISKRFFDRTEMNAKSAKISTPHQRESGGR